MSDADSHGGFWLLFLFSVPFAGVGIAFFALSIIPSLYEWQTMKSWEPTAAILDSAKLEISRGDENDTFRAVASYRYLYDGQTYHGSRVGIMSGSDNMGSWHEDKANELKKAFLKPCCKVTMR